MDNGKTALELLEQHLAELDEKLQPLLRDREITSQAIELARRGTSFSRPALTEKDPTFKEKIRETLVDKFPLGATAWEIHDYINRRWNRRILRSSLSPQLSRLKHDEKVIDYDERTGKWFWTVSQKEIADWL